MSPGVPLRIISALTLGFLCQACAQSSPVVSKSPQEEPPRFVRVEARYGDANPSGLTRFNHPLELNEKEWTRILENVWVRHEPGFLTFASQDEAPIPAFTPDESHVNPVLRDPSGKRHSRPRLCMSPRHGRVGRVRAQTQS